jgi:hypothetical protein
MTVSDTIQLWVAISSGVLAIISTISIVIVLIQNKQIIESSKKAFITMYKEVININSPVEYLVIKNSGNTTAHITSLTYDQESINKLSDLSLDKALEYLNDSYIAPNQFYKLPIRSKCSGLEAITFKIDYLSGKKKYSEIFTINLQQDYGVAYTKQSINGNELKVIANSLQELIKKIS